MGSTFANDLRPCNRLMHCGEPEERLEPGHWGPTPVVAEDELVKVGLGVIR